MELRYGRLAVTGPEPDGWRMVLAPTSDPDAYADGRVSAISLFDATFSRLDPAVAQ